MTAGFPAADSRYRVTREVEQQFLELHDFSSHALTCLPPPVGIECGVVRGANHDPRRVSLHGPTEDSTKAPRVIPPAHHQDRPEPVLVAPVGKNATFVFGSGHGARDLLDGRDTERRELSNASCGRVFVRDAPADELATHGVPRAGENGNSRGDTTVNKVRRLQHPGATRIDRDDDDVGPFDGVVGH